MKIMLLIIVVISSLADIFCQEGNPDKETWMDDRHHVKVKWFESEPVQARLKRLNREPGPLQLFGVMGRRSSAKSQIYRKRQKFQAFVGLMGKRNIYEPGYL